MGAIAIAGLIVAFEVRASRLPVEPADPGLEVELVMAPEPEPEPEPEPTPPQEPKQPPAAAEPPPTQQPPPTVPPPPQRLPAGPALRTIQAPDSIPKGDIKETEPTAANDALDPYGDPEARTGGTGPERAATPLTVPRPTPKKAPKPRRRAAPKRLTEDMTPPRALSTPQPSYPESLRSQGIEGTVIVRFIITAAGNTTNVRAVRGPAALRAACVAAVQRWRFKPAQDASGNPVPLSKTMRFPFRLKTRR